MWMFWCSEPWMFNVVARHVDLWDGTAEGHEPTNPFVQLPVNTLWSFTVRSSLKPGEKFMTFHPPREIKAEGRYLVGFSNRSSAFNTGGEVVNPFPLSHTPGQRGTEEVLERFQQRQRERMAASLDDGIDDLTGNSSISKPTQQKSGSSSSNVLAFQMGSKHTSSSTNLSYPFRRAVRQSPSKTTTKVEQMACPYCLKKELPQNAYKFPMVSLRKVGGYEYITHNVTGTEISIGEFEARTGGSALIVTRLSVTFLKSRHLLIRRCPRFFVNPALSNLR